MTDWFFQSDWLDLGPGAPPGGERGVGRGLPKGLVRAEGRENPGPTKVNQQAPWFNPWFTNSIGLSMQAMLLKTDENFQNIVNHHRLIDPFKTGHFFECLWGKGWVLENCF